MFPKYKINYFHLWLSLYFYFEYSKSIGYSIFICILTLYCYNYWSTERKVRYMLPVVESYICLVFPLCIVLNVFSCNWKCILWLLTSTTYQYKISPWVYRACSVPPVSFSIDHLCSRVTYEGGIRGVAEPWGMNEKVSWCSRSSFTTQWFPLQKPEVYLNTSVSWMNFDPCSSIHPWTAKSAFCWMLSSGVKRPEEDVFSLSQLKQRIPEFVLQIRVEPYSL